MSEKKAFVPGGGIGRRVNSAPGPEKATKPKEKVAFDPKKKPLPKSEPVEPQIIDHTTAGTGLVPTWSPTQLQDYEKCPYMIHLKKVQKIKEPEQEDSPLDRGTALHAFAEAYVTGDQNIIEDSHRKHEATWETKIFPKFQAQFELLHEAHAEAKVECEGDWGFTVDWAPTGWMAKDVWGRMKLDVLHWESETSARVIDHKSGKKFGNEIKHADQGMQYAVGTFMRHPELEFVTTEFWYLDQKPSETFPQRYSREQAMRFLPRITDRATILTSDRDFKPKPSRNNCMWCIGRKTETCEWRVE